MTTPSRIAPTDDLVAARMARSEARLISAVLPGRQNVFGTYGGNRIMSLMEEVAWASAMRFTRMDLITAGSESIRFERPVPSDTMLEAVARVVGMGRTSVTVGVEIFAESVYSDVSVRAAHGTLTLVAVDGEGRPTPITFPEASDATTGGRSGE